MTFMPEIRATFGSESRRREKRAVAGNSVLAALVITSLKIVVGIATGSLGILSEAAHSGLDLIAALMTFFSVRVSDKPSSALVITSLKIVVGIATGSLGILSEAAHSGLDLIAALMTFFSVRVSDKP